MLTKIMCALCVIALGVGTHASAQDDDPNQILDASREAIAATTGFTAKFRMFGDGSDMIKSSMPSMSGQMSFGEHPEYGQSLRMLGESRDRQNAPPYAIDMLKSNAALVWVDMKDKTINEHTVDLNERKMPSAMKLMVFDMLLKDDPFGERMDTAESISLEAQEKVGDELCDVVRVNFAKPEPTGGRGRSSSRSYTSARWFISVTDHLPRRIEQLTDAGLIKFRMVTELTGLVLQAPRLEQIDVLRLPGFKLNSTLHPPEPVEEAAPAIDSKPAETTGSRYERAPVFEFTDADGATINNASQNGRVTVLYFNGSWCLPCRDTTPLVSSLAEAFGHSDVDVFGIAVREGDEDTVRSDFEQDGHAHRLVLSGDDTASRFRVRLYPTIIVINAAGEIVSEGHLTKEFDAQKLVDTAALSIKNAAEG